ncbi:MAG: sulfite exporter TauE/SafE family protein [Chloroflexia bacterium]|nr:sulfite exporter TauE/SafE family protein [Chloroflexia bacterium]MDQ3412873.1 cytochrome c biogenesis protein CcdA [Chloroflexota bacterium]
MVADVTFIAAFIAGVLSISSPCVLPLVPIYLTHLAGVSAGSAGAAARGRVLANAAAYVLGFSVVFIAVGIALGAAGTLVETASVVAGNRIWLIRIGGAVLMLLGFHQIGLIRLPWLDRDRRLQTGGLQHGRVASSFVIGMTFGAGWSPCVGPILGAILTMAAGQGSIERAAWLLTAYSAGLAVPFLLAAVAYGSSPGIIRRLNRRLAIVSTVSGGVMLAMGAIMLLNIYQQIFARLVALSPWIPWEPSL